MSFRAPEGGGGALEKRLRQLVGSSLSEAGCLEYTLHVDVDDPDRFFLYEQWVDQDALDFHDSMTYVHQFVADFPELLAGPPDKRRLRLVG